MINSEPNAKGKIEGSFRYTNDYLEHPKAFSLSPAYDLLPDIHENREHRISFPQGAGTLPPGRKILESIGKIYKVPHPDQVVRSMADWQDVLGKYGTPQEDILWLETGIARRMERLK